MTTAAAQLVSRLLSPESLVGPMFDKELRVASRRRRYYVLRFAYIALLVILIARIWEAVHKGAGASAVVQMSRRDKAGQQITLAIVWFQFITGQILAAVLLSDSISGEIRNRTFDTLLVTPMSSLRIVIGKLLSRLLQLLLLLAISLPLLAIVRVLGGVPWAFTVSCVCITFAAALFAGALSLLGSTFCRKAHEAFTFVGLWYLIVWGISTGLLLGLAAARYIRMASVQSVLLLINPLMVMWDRTTGMLTAGGGSSLWPYHCLIMLAAAAFVIALAVWRVRCITLTSILRRTQNRRPGAETAGHSSRRSRRANRPIRRVRGAPIVWKESRRPLLAQNKILATMMAFVLLAAGVTLLALAVYGMPVPLQAAFRLVITILPLLFMVRVGTAAAGAVTREKEARTWPILLACPLENAEIVRGKIIGVLRQALPLLVPIPVLFLMACLFGEINLVRHTAEKGIAVVMSIIAYAGHVFLLMGLGLYLSTRLKTTSTAVAATLGSYFGVVFLCCCALGPLSMIFGIRGPGSSMLSLFMTNMLHACIFGVAGFGFMTTATRRLRREVFGSG